MPLVRDRTANLKVLKQIIEAFDVMVVTDKADIGDSYMPKLVAKIHKALAQDELIKDYAIKNQWLNVVAKKRSRKNEKAGVKSESDNEEPPKTKGKAKGRGKQFRK